MYKFVRGASKLIDKRKLAQRETKFNSKLYLKICDAKSKKYISSLFTHTHHELQKWRNNFTNTHKHTFVWDISFSIQFYLATTIGGIYIANNN